MSFAPSQQIPAKAGFLFNRGSHPKGGGDVLCLRHGCLGLQRRVGIEQNDSSDEYASENGKNISFNVPFENHSNSRAGLIPTLILKTPLIKK